MILVSTLVGYLTGSLPTANWLARVRGIDLRSGGSGNPGANNALRLGGPALAAAVLLVEVAKGYAVVQLGFGLEGEPGAAMAGLGAVAGNVFNLWYGFKGGKGLGISAGVLAATSPIALAVTFSVIVIVALVTRSSGWAALAALAALVSTAIVFVTADMPTSGLAGGMWLLGLAVGMSLLLGPKHWQDARLRRSGRPATR